MISYELKWHLIWDLIWAQMRLDRGIEKFEVEKCRWHFSINHDVVKQPAKYEFLIPSSFEVRIWLVNRLSLIFKYTWACATLEWSSTKKWTERMFEDFCWFLSTLKIINFELIFEVLFEVILGAHFEVLFEVILEVYFHIPGGSSERPKVVFLLGKTQLLHQRVNSY